MQSTQENIDICLNCVLPKCDMNDPKCPFFAGETPQKAWYRKKCKDKVWLKAQKKKWAERYQRKKTKSLDTPL